MPALSMRSPVVSSSTVAHTCLLGQGQPSPGNSGPNFPAGTVTGIGRCRRPAERPLAGLRCFFDSALQALLPQLPERARRPFPEMQLILGPRSAPVAQGDARFHVPLAVARARGSARSVGHGPDPGTRNPRAAAARTAGLAAAQRRECIRAQSRKGPRLHRTST